MIKYTSLEQFLKNDSFTIYLQYKDMGNIIERLRKSDESSDDIDILMQYNSSLISKLGVAILVIKLVHTVYMYCTVLYI